MATPTFSSSSHPHFFQPLLPDFHTHLIIPMRFFVKHIECKNENGTAKLRSGLSHKTWEVKLDGRRFTDGWEDFATNHDFRVGDIIVFRHDGDMVFHVSGFGPSCCNLQYDAIGNIYGNEKVEKNPRGEAESSSSHSCFVAYVTLSNLRKDTLVLPTRFARLNGLNKRCCDIVLMNEHGRSWTLHLRDKTSREGAYIIRGWRSFCLANDQKVGCFFTLKLVRNGTTPVLQLSTTECRNNCKPEKHSGAKEMTVDPEGEGKSSSGECSKRKAKRTYSVWRLSSSTRQNRIVTLTLSPKIFREGWLVSSNFVSEFPYCTPLALVHGENGHFHGLNLVQRLPLRFTRENGINEPGKMNLVDKCGVEWPTTLWMEKKTGIMGLGKGLRNFFGAIQAKEGESIVMDLSWRDKTPVLQFCSKIQCDIKPEESEAVAEATDQMVNDKQNICETLTTPVVLVKEEPCLGASRPEFGAFECVSNPSPEKRFGTKEKKISSRKRSGRDKSSSREGKTDSPRTRKTWKLSDSPRQNRFATVTVTPYCMRRSKLSLPTKFMKVNGIERPRKIILVDKGGVKRPNNLVCVGQRRMGLGRGWKGFCKANDVKTGESFVLELIWEDKTPVLRFCSKVKTE